MSFLKKTLKEIMNDSANLKIVKTNLGQKDELLALYKTLAGIKDGLIRQAEEINSAYVEGFLKRSLSNGLSLIAVYGNFVVGEIHAYTPSLFAFRHILTDLTIVVNPDFQGKGIGRRLFNQFLKTVNTEMTHISRIELFTRETNLKNIHFYKSLGFIDEGRQQNKILKKNNEYETPVHMAWLK
ncbi:MAG: GNAT family N-acetyltransferase [Bacteroidota bacterium]